MGGKEWTIGNSGEICAYCHKPITEICGCGSNDMKFKNLFKQLADQQNEITALRQRLEEAKGLLNTALEMTICNQCNNARKVSNPRTGYQECPACNANSKNPYLQKRLKELY